MQEFQLGQKVMYDLGQKVMYDSSAGWVPAEVIEFVKLLGEEHVRVQIDEAYRDLLTLDELCEMQDDYQKEQKPMKKFFVGQKVMVYFEDDDLKAAEIVELHRVENSDIQYARLRMSASGRIVYRFTDELRDMQEEQQKEQKPMKEKLYRVFYDNYYETKYLIPWEQVSAVIAEIAVAHGDAFDEHSVEILELCDVKVAVEKSVKIGLVRQ